MVFTLPMFTRGLSVLVPSACVALFSQYEGESSLLRTVKAAEVDNSAVHAAAVKDLANFVVSLKNEKRQLEPADTSNIFTQIGPEYNNSIKWDGNWDSREPESLIKPEKLAKMNAKERAEALDKLKAKGTRNLILIRHGQYNMDPENDADKTLTTIGREQAALTGQRMAALGVAYTRMIHSTMKRATETADLIDNNLKRTSMPRSSDPMLEEGAPFPPEPSLGHWRPSKKEFVTDGSRIEAAFRKYFHRAEPTQEADTFDVLVCHGNVIRYFVCRALQFPPEGWLRFSVANSSITWVMIRPSGRVVIKSFGDSGHLPPNLVTYS